MNIICVRLEWSDGNFYEQKEHLLHKNVYFCKISENELTKYTYTEKYT